MEVRKKGCAGTVYIVVLGFKFLEALCTNIRTVNLCLTEPGVLQTATYSLGREKYKVVTRFVAVKCKPLHIPCEVTSLRLYVDT